MAITIKYQSRYFDPKIRTDRYVRFDSEGFHFIEVDPSDRKWDVRQGDVTEDEIPEAVADAARARMNQYPSYVEWPHDN